MHIQLYTRLHVILSTDVIGVLLNSFLLFSVPSSWARLQTRVFSQLKREVVSGSDSCVKLLSALVWHERDFLSSSPKICIQTAIPWKEKESSNHKRSGNLSADAAVRSEVLWAGNRQESTLPLQRGARQDHGIFNQVAGRMRRKKQQGNGILRVMSSPVTLHKMN